MIWELIKYYNGSNILQQKNPLVYRFVTNWVVHTWVDHKSRPMKQLKEIINSLLVLDFIFITITITECTDISNIQRIHF